MGAGRADCWQSQFGTSFESKHWLSLDPCGSVGITMSFSIHLYALAVISVFLISNSMLSTTLFLVVYVPCALLALASLFMAWTTDPGAVPMGARPLVTVRRAASGDQLEQPRRRKRGMRRCHKCNDNFKPPRAHHDSVTGRCIVKMDHYCPWVCNAIGALNHKFFVLFIFYTMLTSICAILLIVIRAMSCSFGFVPEPKEVSSGMETEVQVVGNSTTDDRRSLLEGDIPDECIGMYTGNLVLILLIVAVAFLVFTCCMLVEQIDAIQTNTGKIARMKLKVGQGGTELSRVTEEFNEMFGGTSPDVALHWFLPLPVQFPSGMEKVILGYEWDATFEASPCPDSSDDEEAHHDDRSLTSSKSLPVKPTIAPLSIESGGVDDDEIGMSEGQGYKKRPASAPARRLTPPGLKMRSSSRGIV